MSEIRHLARAPIIEAMVYFQANAVRLWDPKKIPPAFSALWPEFAVVQEVRPLQIEVTQTPKGQLPPKVTFPPLQGFMFRSKTQASVVHQVRRDGYLYSRLEPYENWDSLQAAALAGWGDYRKVLEPEDLHAVAVRFINRVKFLPDGFSLARYFTTPPVAPPGLNWQFHGFMHTSFYSVPASPCAVKVAIMPAFDATSRGCIPS